MPHAAKCEALHMHEALRAVKRAKVFPSIKHKCFLHLPPSLAVEQPCTIMHLCIHEQHVLPHAPENTSITHLHNSLHPSIHICLNQSMRLALHLGTIQALGDLLSLKQAQEFRSTAITSGSGAKIKGFKKASSRKTWTYRVEPSQKLSTAMQKPTVRHPAKGIPTRHQLKQNYHHSITEVAVCLTLLQGNLPVVSRE